MATAELYRERSARAVRAYRTLDTETAVSIEEATAPAGTYDAPSGYGVEEFDFMKMMQGQ